MASYTLVLAEKPSVAKDLAKVLGCAKTPNGHYQNNQYIVTNALGHLVTMALPEEYHKEWEKWELATLPMLPDYLKTTVIKQTSQQFHKVKSLLMRSDVKDIIIATDAGREGELVARLIIEKAKVNKPTKRLWVSSMTDNALQKGFKELKSSREYDGLYDSAKARMMADWLVGINVTRALTCKYNAQLSAGRVQTPTLAVIVNREQEISNFVPVAYYQIYAFYQNVPFLYINQHGVSDIYQKAVAEGLKNDTDRKTAEVVKITKTPKRVAPPLLFDLTELQRVANQKYGFSPKKTLDLTQSLYEHHKLVTYPRTDSSYLPNEYFSEISRIFSKLKVIISVKCLPEAIKNIDKFAKSKRIFDSSKVTDHHAIIPTDNDINTNYLSDDEYKIYMLIVKRFVCVFLNDYQYDVTQIDIKIEQHRFFVKSAQMTSLGYRAEYNEETSEVSDKLPPLKVGDRFVGQTQIKELKTTPPSRYTEATLLSAMEHPGRFVEDSKMKNILEQTSGLGTPATRAEIIEKLFSTGYIELIGKSISPTKKGKQLIGLVPDDLKSPLLTAQFEEKLKLMAVGKASFNHFIQEVTSLTKTLTKTIVQHEAKFQHDNRLMKKCPSCEQPLLEVVISGRTYHQCSNRCGYRKLVKMLSNARCPKCHKKMHLFVNENSESFICSCGFKCQKATFIEDLKEKKNDLSRGQVKQYMQKQNNAMPTNNPFAQLFDKDNNK